MERLSLAEQIAQFDQTAPVDFDPEVIQVDGPEGGDGGLLGAATEEGREHYFAVGPSNLRKLHESVSDPKYAGMKTSRKDIMGDSESEGGAEDDESANEEGFDDEDLAPGTSTGPQESDGSASENGSSDDDDDEHSEEEGESQTDVGIPKTAQSRPAPPEESADVTSALKRSRDEDTKKGKAVKRQTTIWDSLLNSRIRLQKAVVTANQLPPPHIAKDYLADADCQEAVSRLLSEASALTEDLIELQELFMTVNDIPTPPPSKRRRVESDMDLDDLASYFQEATTDAAIMEQTFHPYLLQTLAKWSAKIQAVAPAALLPSNKGSFVKGKQPLKSVNQLIDDVLGSHKDLLERTQTVRGKRGRLGVPQMADGGAEATIVDEELFDDTDFYQKMLRDVIDARGNNGGVDDWMLLQKQKKAKKNVDTKASKGRKLRFEVHEKIQNFMVPVPIPGSWHEEQIDELFASLLGKGFETEQPEADALNFEHHYQHTQSTAFDHSARLIQFERSPLLSSRDMEHFEDENPFDADAEHIHSETSSASKSGLYDEELYDESPTPHPSATLSPTAHSLNKASFPSHGSHKSQPANFKTDFCCACDRYLHSGDDAEIQIVDALKTSLNSNSPYIAYVIRTRNAEAHHRYSEFESLRDNLSKLYPTFIIPPIPSKQTIGDYAVKQAKAKEDASMIAQRKRLLQTFLNRLARHPILSNEHVFHRFLEGEVSWTEILNSPPLTLLPKNILKAPSHNPTDPNASPAYTALPNPSAAHPLRNPDQRFLDSEAFTNKFANHVSGPMEKTTRRVIKRWSDFSQDHSDLGAALNAFSLNEPDALSSAIEKTGQAIDTTHLSTNRLLEDLEQDWAEPLHEYAQFASIIKKLLAYRHQKHVQCEMTQDALENKRDQLEELEKSEKEARRLEDALGRGRFNGPSGSSQATTPPAGGEQDGHDHSEPSTPNSGHLPPHPGPSPVRRRTRAPGMGLLNALSYTLHGMMDVDPETARRNGITKTRESISQLEDGLHLAAQDLKYSSSTIQADLDRFQRQKVADIREMTISMAKSHRDWCKKNLEAWEEAKREIDKIPDHPNKATQASPEQTPAVAAGPSARRDSTATAVKE